MYGIAYYIYFQLTGTILIALYFQHEKASVQLLLGSAAGSLLSAWLPILFAFFTDFTPLAHALALLITLPAWGAAGFKRRAFRLSAKGSCESFHTFFRENAAFFCLLLLFLAFWCYLLHTHTLLPGEDGGIYTGQCTYGDMNMHLGFLTSLARQTTFPPDYSILPGVKLSYPFLSDSVSSSLLVLGTPLRLAYLFPMLFAMAQIFCTVYLLARSLLASVSKALLTLLLFFFNGGFGFVYFIGRSEGQGYRFSDIFTGFYTTPTNLIEKNIRWVNIVADMLLPQRATLFGYAALFPALFLLYRAVFCNRRTYFLPAGLFVAALPMIHTHSFLSAGIVSGVWLILWLRRELRTERHGELNTRRQNPLHSKLQNSAYNARYSFRRPAISAAPAVASGLFVLFLAVMCLIQYLDNRSLLSSHGLMLIGCSIFIAAVIYGICLLSRYILRFGCRTLLISWGVYLACILALALPQLLYWTFGQVAAGGFVRGHFNWGNQGDFYPWFYIKNLGIVLLPIAGGICACRKKTAPLCFSAFFLWWAGEFIVFTPNTYDNNKILYVAYLLLCVAAADYSVELYRRIRNVPGRRLLAASFLFCAAFSAVLTLGREAVSRYQLYSPAQTALAAFIDENTETDAVFLTNTRHNNEISSLTGRSIVCGADTFLYFHGLDTSRRRQEVQLMYESPLEHRELFEKYDVSYIVVSPFERNSYQIEESLFEQNFAEVYCYEDTILYQYLP